MQLDSMFLSFYSPAIVGYPCQMATGQQFWGMAVEEVELVRERSSFKLRVAQDESQFRNLRSLSLERTRLATLAKQMSRANPT